MLNVIELFAGVGGFRLGLEKTGFFDVVWGNQWEPSKKVQDAFQCYATHFPGEGHSNVDIASVNVKDIPEAQMIVGGFPCQDYSVARSLSGEKGIEGKKGVLFWEIMRLIKELKSVDRPPKYILLENVDRLLKSPSKQRGRDFAIMLKSFHDEGYDVEWRVINAADYGLAQRRRRVFIFAYQRSLSYTVSLNETDDQSILEQFGFFADKFPVEGYNGKPRKNTQGVLPEDIVSLSETYKAQFYKSGIMRNGQFTSIELTPVNQPPTPLEQILLRQEIDKKYFLSADTIEKFKFLKGPKKIERTTATGHTYVFSEGGMALPESPDLPGRTMLTSEGTVNRSSHVVADPLTGKWRYLTPIECERLNGFPDDWTNTGMSERMRYFCMGNALVVDLITRMGERIRDIEVKEKSSNLVRV